MDEGLRALVRERAAGCCEYCQLAQELALWATFHVEHVVAKQHRGTDAPSNLAWACDRCNLNKGPNLTGRDPRTEKVTVLFHPRRHKWERHFRWEGPLLVGKTAVGRTTIDVLGINHSQRALLRETLIAEGVFPP